MIRSYLLISLRAILKNKLTSFINIAGLMLAMTSAVMIYLFVSDELSYDRYHPHADNTYRVTRTFYNRDGVANLKLSSVAPPIGPLIKNDFGEVQVMARTLQNSLVMAIEENGERSKMATEKNVYMAEPALFSILDIPLKSGSVDNALERPFTVLLSENAAQKYFGTNDVIGKRLIADGSNTLEVTGVFKNFPAQTHWHPDFLVSFSTLNDSTIYGRKQLETNWGNNSFSTYLLLDTGVDPKKIEAAFPAFLDKHFGPYAKANYGVPADFVASRSTKLELQNIQSIHLHSHLDDELEVNGNINNVYMMCVIGVFIILIACFNFVNLSTARASKRAKEVGLRKAVGAFKNQLIIQYLSESILIAWLSLALSAPLSWTCIDWLNHFTGKSITLNFMQDWYLFIGLFLFATIVGTLAGIYPAFVLSSFKPALVLKGQQGSVGGKGWLRKALVVSQFAISIILIIATIITREQLHFLNSENLGFDKERVITLPFYGELTNGYDAFYHELTKSAAIKNATRSSRIPTGRLLDSQGSAMITKGDSLINSNVELKYITTDYEFFNTYGISFAAGRDFSRSIPTDDTLAYIVNEAAVKAFGWKDNSYGIDKDFQYGSTKGKLIGVVNDFHFESLHQRVVPMIFLPAGQSYYNNLTIKISAADFQSGIAHIQKVWKDFLPSRPFDYEFISERYKKLYESEEKENTLFSLFSGLAIFIASLGLFGLATFSTLQRIKEIGIRKVLGASVGNILSLLSTEIILLIAIANLIAWPVGWYFMSEWLGTFAYHIDMNILAYIFAAILTITLALVTISIQTLKAATTNPAKTLKYE